MAVVHDLRGRDPRPFDVVVGIGRDDDPAAFAAAGATWLLTDTDPATLTLDTARGILRDGPRRP